MPSAIHQEFIQRYPYAECILQWDVPPNIVDHLEAYYIHHWDREYFQTRCSGTGYIGHRDKIYSVMYHEHNPMDLFKYKEVILSFRKIPSCPRGWVLVRPKLGTEIV